MYDLSALSRSLGLLLFLGFVIPTVMAVVSGPLYWTLRHVDAALSRLLHRRPFMHR